MGAKYGAATSLRSCCAVLGDQDGWGTNRLSKAESILGTGMSQNLSRGRRHACNLGGQGLRLDILFHEIEPECQRQATPASFDHLQQANGNDILRPGISRLVEFGGMIVKGLFP